MEWFRSILLRPLAESLDLLKGDENYIHMKLPIKKISREFEAELKKKTYKDINTIKIREATKKDAQVFIQLHKVIWTSTSMPYKPFSRDLVEKLIEKPYIIFLIANVNNKDVGFAIIHYIGEEKQIGIITAIGIIPEHRRKGFGTMLGLEIWKYFKKKGLEELRCRVSKDNKNAYLFIKNLGFEKLDDYP